jgi:hypothetical protein
LGIAVPTLSAVMFQRGFQNRFFIGPRPLNPNMPRFCGAAWTIRAIPIREDLRAAIATGQIPSRNRLAFDAAPRGSVVVCGTGGNPHIALMGYIMSTSLMIKGVAGVVLDTDVPDAQFIASMALPVIATGSAPVSSFALITQRPSTAAVCVSRQCRNASLVSEPAVHGQLVYSNGDRVQRYDKHVRPGTFILPASRGTYVRQTCNLDTVHRANRP